MLANVCVLKIYMNLSLLVSSQEECIQVQQT